MANTGGVKILQLVNDLVIYEDRCNLHCQYCLAAESPFHPRDPRDVASELSDHPLRYGSGSPLKATLDEVLVHYGQFFDAPILKISGGEAFLVAGLCSLVEHSLHSYESVQILTNGTLLSEHTLRTLAQLPGVHLQISLDGHTHAMNRPRLPSRNQHQALLGNLDRVAAFGIPLEVFCVLHACNADCLADFADYLLDRFNGTVGLTPFPVRGSEAASLAPRPEQQVGIDRLIADFDHYRPILPPLVYLRHLKQIVFERQPRRIRCFVPLVMLQSFEHGAVTPCPYSWVEEIGNLAICPRDVANRFGKTAGYRIRRQEPPRAAFCQSCITDAYALSLFFNHDIDFTDLSHNRPIFGRPRAQARLFELLARFDADGGSMNQ